MPTLVATVGSASANSFCTLAEANTYFDERPDSDCWGSQGATEKVRALLFAAKQLNAMDWLGSRVDSTQSMAWPRYDVWKPDGYAYYDSTEIPQPVKDAQCELAYQVIQSSSLTSATTSGAISAFKQGDVHITYDTNNQSASAVATTEQITATYLWGLVSAGTRLMRA